MTPADFGLGMLASWLANKVDLVFKPEGSEPLQIIPPEPKIDNDIPPIERVRKFKTFDAFHDLPQMVNDIDSPLVSILIERSPSSHYNLVCVVLESRLTGEWFVFSRGRMAFQGSGGGHTNSNMIIQTLKKKKSPIVVWVYDNNFVDDLESGFVLWPEIKGKGIPLRSLVSNDSSWTTITNQAEEMLTKA
ncbi:hypothetical protein [uncultured Ferrimonas sp.]|uniref:hypothetical protein n=1 Tax=uncultured Ferrimonas sp. TaxID=432640 RepID=UPI0026306B7F|nr:hypothetical protein [uncultured Ferrimonas sp.]